jgi:EAL domain-containing protein (putative c-di-GMP-specific phosphodiesterase class I)
MAVLAEGVERKEQMDFLQAEGCIEAQGFLFGRPQPLDQIARQVGRGTQAGAKPRSSVSRAA